MSQPPRQIDVTATEREAVNRETVSLAMAFLNAIRLPRAAEPDSQPQAGD